MKSEAHFDDKNNQRKFWEVLLSSFYESNPKDKRSSFNKRPTCGVCDINDASWENSIIHEYCCDDCVPRGCSCTLVKTTKSRKFEIEGYSYKLDKEGVELPCEDWHKF